MKEEGDVGFRRAERKKAWLKIALTGPSGAGKTLSALYIAQAMGQKIGVIDTENDSASLYADKIPQGFDTLNIEAPYTVQKYVAAMKLAYEAGLDVLIMDSISHAWAGDGGLLMQKEGLDARGGKNQFANWGPITKQHEAFKAAMLAYDGHLIVTMRSKQDYLINEETRKVAKVGMAPVQRDGMEYEFTTVFDVAQNHTAEASKDRTQLFSGIFTITPDTGKALIDWLNGGTGSLSHRERVAVPERTASAAAASPLPSDFQTTQQQDPNHRPSLRPTEKQLTRLYAIANSKGWSRDEVHVFILEKLGKSSTLDLVREEYDRVCNYLLQLKPKPPGPALGSKEDIMMAAVETHFAPSQDELGVPL